MKRRRMLNLLLAGLTLPVGFSAWAAGQRIQGARLWQDGERTRLVFDLTGPVRYQTFQLAAPDRVVVDLANTQALSAFDHLVQPGSPIRAVRSAPYGAGGTRVVLELSQPVALESFALGPGEGAGSRLVLDLHRSAPPAVAARPAAPAASQAPLSTAAATGRDIVVVVDAGHGGKDPGALSARGDREKDVALIVARNLARRIDRQKGFKAKLVRNDDFFVPLRKRVEVARTYKADMFVSVHADAAPRRTAYGASVYALSESGATSTTARFLAERENDVDLLGANEILKGRDPMLAGVLLDMSMNATIASSLALGQQVLGQLSGITALHQKRVEQAGFAVLKSPDIPSILVETGFISNDRDCRRLLDVRHQQQLAESIFAGLHGYFRECPPQGSYLASLKQQGVA